MSLNNIEDEWICSCDIEFAFVDLVNKSSLKIIRSFEDDEYSVEDKSHLGWGITISRNSEWVGDRRNISELIRGLLSKVINITNYLNENDICCSPIIRIGIYHESYSFTTSLDSELMNQLGELSIDIEFSVYAFSKSD